MSHDTLDDVDRGILHLLQEDARNMTTTEIGDAVGVSASTVGNRLQRLEEAGVIRGYHPQIDYHEAGFPLRVLFICTAPIPEREELAAEALDASGVVNVKEIMVGVQNLHVEAVATTREDATEVSKQLDDMGLDVVDQLLVKDEHMQPYDHFGQKDVSD
ncbi:MULTISPECIES: AsnC family transcriptional regulator [unclassified Haladaptatus]|uniref:Lrp/AsnC family transcriptional regulator n=1 Tax=unclassified Haladaptatus TaxID=2622732 RepID=UPI00209BE000|nr:MULTISPECIES: AsnC family transcriptional regulator [unclassified Haladaptatus]MCO8244599.1 AsnC family transcriptional regulator [Haladaptatus sp. AB643]MCO8253779.1 AsnC family transcriptional regulator [Haladaptatus sp. AB618]